jgi:hypothetical protein
MSSTPLIGAAIAVFVVAALLYYQSTSLEAFANPSTTTGEDKSPVPADLNTAPVAAVTQTIPPGTQRPLNVPGPAVATTAKEAPAQRKDLNELDNKISTWLDGATQREGDSPGTLTPEQLQRRVMLQARLADVRTQLGTGMITDSYRVVAQETLDLRRENAGWRQMAPTLEAVHDFAKGYRADDFLTAELYAQFRGLFNAGLKEMQGLMQPDPLQRVRLQQLQVIRQDIESAERRLPQGAVLPIRVASAQLFLKQMLKPDQPMPTLFSMEPNPATLPSHADSPADVIGALKDIQWKLTVSYDPAEQELKRAVADMLDRLQAGAASRQEIEAARNSVISLQNRRAPMAAAPGTLMRVSGFGSRKLPIEYDPSNLPKRAMTLCKQVREAFPADAEALGCPGPGPASKHRIDSELEAESTINIVCDRLRYSVPSVSPEQFNCPKG